MRTSVFTGTIDQSVKTLWNRINLSLILHCLPSDIDNELNRDIQAIKVILAARNELQERNQGSD